MLGHIFFWEGRDFGPCKAAMILNIKEVLPKQIWNLKLISASSGGGDGLKYRIWNAIDIEKRKGKSTIKYYLISYY